MRYFDYKLAYDMYRRVDELFQRGGVDELERNGFEIEDTGNGYATCRSYNDEYHAEVYLSDKNFDTKNTNIDWYVSGEVDLYNDEFVSDNLFINKSYELADRVFSLLAKARNGGYTLEDVYYEYDSIISVIEDLRERK